MAVRVLPYREWSGGKIVLSLESFSGIDRKINPVYKRPMQSPQDIFGLWPTNAALGAAGGAKPDTARKWRKAARIPQEYWPNLIDAASLKGYSLTADDLMRASAPMKQRGRPAHKAKRRARRSIEPRASA